jgi:pimeloyl-ACP methyl ester carboxylesterase
VAGSVSTEMLRTRGDLNLAVERVGVPGRPTIVLLHGGGQTRHSWRTAAVAFADRGYHSVSYDARGHGESDWSPSGDYSFGSLSADLADVLSTVHGPVALVGASMGGMTAYHTAGSTTRELRALVLVDIVPRPAVAGTARILAFMRSHADGFARLEDAADAVAAYYPERPRPRDISGLRKNLRQHHDGRLYWHYDPRLVGTGVASEPPSFGDWAVEKAAHIRAPVLLVRGGKSDLVDDAGVVDLQQLLPQAEVLNVAGTGHMLVGNRNDAFNDGLLAYIQRQMPAG